MATVIGILLAQGCLGAFDTVYYHELRARLPGRPEARPELLLHAARDFVYAVIFATLPNLAFHGAWAALLAAMLLAEVVITLADFVVEDTVRRPQGGVFPGERVMHAIMAIVYGAMLANLLPILWAWSAEPSALVGAPAGVPGAVRLVMGGMAVGVGASGVRDLLAALGVQTARWPYAAESR
jgi:hypothetical protein